MTNTVQLESTTPASTISIQSSPAHDRDHQHQLQKHSHPLLHSLQEHTHHIARSHPHLSLFCPRFDLEEHEDKYILYGELPGCLKQNIQIHAIGDQNIEIEGYTRRYPVLADVPNTTDLKAGDIKPSDAEKAKETTMHWPHLDKANMLAALEAVPQLSYEHANTPTSNGGSHTTDKHVHIAGQEANGSTTQEQVGSNGGEIGITGTQNEPHHFRVRHVFQERLVGEFQRTIHFPGPVEIEKAIAELHDGILYIVVPKDKLKEEEIAKKRAAVEWASANACGMY